MPLLPSVLVAMGFAVIAVATRASDPLLPTAAATCQRPGNLENPRCVGLHDEHGPPRIDHPVPPMGHVVAPLGDGRRLQPPTHPYRPGVDEESPSYRQALEAYRAERAAFNKRWCGQDSCVPPHPVEILEALDEAPASP